MQIAAPAAKEREKIGHALASVDDEIDLLNSQATALRRQKRGLMQRLLTGALSSIAAAPETVAA